MEHEIIGHTKKAYKTLKSPNKPFGEKAKEIAIEILIIVFAVTFAAFIERTREHYKEKAEAKEFIIGLKSDLINEINLLEESKRDMGIMRKNYALVEQLKISEIDSIEKTHPKNSFNIASFNTHLVNGRYDGFKSSGKIQTIANDSLRNKILKFYQEDIPSLDFTENVFNQNQNRLADLLISNSDDKGNKSVDMVKVLASGKGKLIIEFSLGYSKSVVDCYNAALNDAKKIIAAIDKEVE